MATTALVEYTAFKVIEAKDLAALTAAIAVEIAASRLPIGGPIPAKVAGTNDAYGDPLVKYYQCTGTLA